MKNDEIIDNISEWINAFIAMRPEALCECIE